MLRSFPSSPSHGCRQRKPLSNRRRSSPPHHVFYFSISRIVRRDRSSNTAAITHRNKVTNNACVTRKCIKIHAAYLFSTHKREWEKEVGAGCLIEVAPWEIFFGQISKMLLPLIIILYPGEELRSHRLETIGRKRCARGSRGGIRKQRRPTFPLAANSLAGNNYMMNANYMCSNLERAWYNKYANSLLNHNLGGEL